MLLLKYSLVHFSDTWITTIIRWGDNRDVQEFEVKGHLGVIWGHCSKMTRTLLRLHNSIDFDETWWRDPWPEVLLKCSGIFGRRSSWGHLGSLLKGQISNRLLQQNWLCQCVGLCQPSKVFVVTSSSDLWLRGQRSEKFSLFLWWVKCWITYYKKSSTVNVLVLVNHHKVFTATSSFDQWLRGQRSWKFKFR